MTRHIHFVLITASALAIVAMVVGQADVPRREPVKMSFYREATGINANISGIKVDVAKFAEEYESALKKKDSAEIFLCIILPIMLNKTIKKLFDLYSQNPKSERR